MNEIKVFYKCFCMDYNHQMIGGGGGGGVKT